MKRTHGYKKVDKRVARTLFDALTGWRTGFPQSFDEVIHKALAATRTIRMAALSCREVIAVEHVAKLGLYAGINGVPGFRLTFPDWLNRRWRAVARRAYRTGYEYGTAKASGNLA